MENKELITEARVHVKNGTRPATAELIISMANAIERLEAAIDRLRAAQEWQPIETAPRDGTHFWGLVGTDAVKMFWHPEFDAFVSKFRRMTMAPGLLINGKEYEDHSPTSHSPTHWRPLPEPPNA